MDWKPERAVQAKVRDSQNKRKIKQKAWLLKRANGGTLCVGLQMATSSRPWVNNGLYPQETSVATLYQVLPPSAARLVHNNIISKEDLPSVCTAMSLRLPSYMCCLVSSSSPVICNYTAVQSSIVYTVVQSSTVYLVKRVTFIHTFIQLYIHTWILSHINAYTA